MTVQLAHPVAAASQPAAAPCQSATPACQSAAADGQAITPTAAGKVLAILDAFGPGRPELSLSELARRSGLPLSTTHRIVAELLAWGGLERGEDQRYRVGLHLWEVASLAPRGLGLRETAMPYLSDLYEATRENVQLAVREDTELVFVERLAGRHSVPIRTRVGGRFPISVSGAGLVLLAYASCEVQERVLATPVRPLTPHTLVSPLQLRRALAEVRRCGMAISDRQVSMDTLSVAAPVTGRSGAVDAAISVVVAAEGADLRLLTSLVRTAARGISHALGAPVFARESRAS